MGYRRIWELFLDWNWRPHIVLKILIRPILREIIESGRLARNGDVGPGLAPHVHKFHAEWFICREGG